MGRENVSTRIFGREALREGDVVTDFSAWVGDKIGQPLPELERILDLNEALAAECGALLAWACLCNRGNPEAQAEYMALSLWLRHFAERLPSRKAVLPEALRRRIAQVTAKA